MGLNDPSKWLFASQCIKIQYSSYWHLKPSQCCNQYGNSIFATGVCKLGVNTTVWRDRGCNQCFVEPAVRIGLRNNNGFMEKTRKDIAISQIGLSQSLATVSLDIKFAEIRCLLY